VGCLLHTTGGQLRVIADYATLTGELRASDDGWIEVQEQDAVQTRHLIRRSAILSVTEQLDDGAVKPISARILDTR
jgi:hypothetical protein